MPSTTQQCSMKKDRVSAHEWASSHNRRDQRLILVNVIFYLKGTARVWLETHEDDPTSWDQCKVNLHQVFWKQQLSAKEELASCIRMPTVSYVMYLQDVLALCQEVDHAMPGSGKVCHVMKALQTTHFTCWFPKAVPQLTHHHSVSPVRGSRKLTHFPIFCLAP